MTANRIPQSSSRSTIALLLMGVGALLLVLVPLLLVFLAVTGSRDVNLPGTLVILSVVGGMALVVLGAALRA